jgi:hypothetical protein
MIVTVFWDDTMQCGTDTNAFIFMTKSNLLGYNARNIAVREKDILKAVS